jgi:hypothetical protein
MRGPKRATPSARADVCAKPSTEPEADQPAPSFEEALAPFAPGDARFTSMPLPNGMAIRFKRFDRYGELDEFVKDRQRWVKRAVGKMVPEVAGIEGLTHAEASALYTLHHLAIEPTFPLTEDAARKIVGSPFFVQVALTWLQNTGFSAAEDAFLEAIAEGKG